MEIISGWQIGLWEVYNIIGPQVVLFMGKLLVGVIIFGIGWIIGSFVCGVIEKAVKATKVDALLDTAGASEFVRRAGFELNIGLFLGTLVKWFIIVIFIITALGIFNLGDVNKFLADIIAVYIPKVIVATLILALGAIFADLAKKVLTGGTRALDSKSSGFIGGIARWAIWIFSIFTALGHLGIGGDVAVELFRGLVFMLALAGGLSFGLGGKEAAANYIEKIRKDISN